eukprot:m.339772 g.339772  ORF g.339772 m.339772 type:complete len:96 (+) comp55753_c0_seq4:1596-1883(+)
MTRRLERGNLIDEAPIDKPSCITQFPCKPDRSSCNDTEVGQVCWCLEELGFYGRQSTSGVDCAKYMPAIAPESKTSFPHLTRRCASVLSLSSFYA